MTCVPNIVATLILVSIAPPSTVSDVNATQMSSLSPRPELQWIDSATASRGNLSDANAAGSEPDPAGELTRPHVITTEIADVIVQIRGGTICTGTPITGTRFVVTAAHCVLDEHGEVSGSRTVLRDGVKYTALSVLVDPAYDDSPSPRLDAAVLLMDKVIAGPSATLGDVFPAAGLVTLAGYQARDTDGSLLRGTHPHNRPLPKGTTGGVVRISSVAAGCVVPASQLEITDGQVTVPCGLIPGASGGGLFVEDNGQLSLVGIISTVTDDLTDNGVVPLSALHELLDNPVPYSHSIPVGLPIHSPANVVRS